MRFWRYFKFDLSKFPGLAAVSTFYLTQMPGPILVTEDIMGFQESGDWSHGSNWPWQELVDKMEPTSFWDGGSSNLLQELLRRASENAFGISLLLLHSKREV